jgi:TadE-like protein
VSRHCRTDSDRGSAPAEFVLVGALVTLMFLALLQLGVDFYVRNVLAAAVSDGARYAANADVANADDGAAAANREIAGSLGSRFATAYAPAGRTSIDGAQVATVEARVRLPLLAWFLPVGPVVQVTGHALVEPPA